MTMKHKYEERISELVGKLSTDFSVQHEPAGPQQANVIDIESQVVVCFTNFQYFLQGNLIKETYYFQPKC